MEHWASLDRLLTAATEPGVVRSIAERLQRQQVRLAVWTFVQDQLPAVRQVVAVGVEIAPIVPNLPSFVRDVTGGGPIKAMLGRFRALPLGTKFALPLRNAGNALKLAKQDFGMGLSILAEMELARCTPLGIRRAVISSAVVDLAVALNNREALVRLLALIERRFRLSVVVETANLGVTASKMIEWGIDTERLIYLSPVNRAGYGMRPSQAACELVCRSGRVRVVAADIDCDGELRFDDAEPYVRALGVQGYLVPNSIR
jgi:hypothetical protein